MQDLYLTLMKDKLTRYNYAHEYVRNAEKQIAELNLRKETKMIGDYGEKTPSGGIKNNSQLLNVLAEIDLLETNIRENKKIIKEIENSFIGLNDMERDIVIEIYSKPYKHDKIDTLKDKYHFSKPNIYKIGKKCIEHMSMKIYGDK